MNKRDPQQIDRYTRVKAFLDGHPAPTPYNYAEQQNVLDDVVNQLSSHCVGQVAGRKMSKAERDKQRVLVRALRNDHLRPLAVIALAHVDGHPGIDKNVTIPKPGSALRSCWPKPSRSKQRRRCIRRCSCRTVVPRTSWISCRRRSTR